MRAGPALKRVDKPWGHEIWWAQAPAYVGKLIVIEKSKRLSLQYHKKKHETIYVLRGRLRLRLGPRSRLLAAGAAATIPPKTVHRFEAPFGRVTLLEVSTPEVWDVVRLQDDYGRSGRAPKAN